jgi:hypothetical protein
MLSSRIRSLGFNRNASMQRRHFLFLAPLLPAALLAPRLLNARARQNPPANHVRDAANRIDELAQNIHTPADARRLVDFIAELFADELPPAWTTASLRNRLAEREYESATDPEKRISEQHLTQTWNAYVSTIGATHESQVSVAELHNLRDSLYATSRLTWSRGSRNFWSVPSIFATEGDGTLAPGCRVIECLRLVWDLANMPENLRAARDRASKGILTSDLLKQALQKPSSSSAGTRASLSLTVRNNPVEVAETQYIRENGIAAFTSVVQTMLTRL